MQRAAPAGHSTLMHAPSCSQLQALLPTTPDLVVIPTLPGSPHEQVQPSEHDIFLIEWFHTYCPNLAAEHANRDTRHYGLQDLLAGAGWRTVQRAAVGVSHSGLITANFADILSQIGLQRSQIKQLAVDVARRAVQSSSNIISMRKGARRGRDLGQHAQDLDPPPPSQSSQNRRRGRDNDVPRPSRRARYTAARPRAKRPMAGDPDSAGTSAQQQHLTAAPSKRRASRGPQAATRRRRTEDAAWQADDRRAAKRQRGSSTAAAARAAAAAAAQIDPG